MKLANLLTRTAARVIHDITDAPRVRREIRRHRANQAPASTRRVPAPLAVEDIKGEIPAVAEVEEAARLHDQAREKTNEGSRLKRRAEKVLKRTPDGVYGPVTVERFESSRQVADLDAIKALFEQHGLGPVPMKTCSPSLVITWAAENTEAEPALVAA